MCMLDELKKQRDEIYEIANRNKAKKVYVFGSCARKEETPEGAKRYTLTIDDYTPQKTFIQKG